MALVLFSVGYVHRVSANGPPGVIVLTVSPLSQFPSLLCGGGCCFSLHCSSVVVMARWRVLCQIPMIYFNVKESCLFFLRSFRNSGRNSLTSVHCDSLRCCNFLNWKVSLVQLVQLEFHCLLSMAFRVGEGPEMLVDLFSVYRPLDCVD